MANRLGNNGNSDRLFFFELQLCSQLAKTSYFICLTLSFLVMKAKELGAKLKTLLVLKMYEALILILNPGFSNT